MFICLFALLLAGGGLFFAVNKKHESAKAVVVGDKISIYAESSYVSYGDGQMSRRYGSDVMDDGIYAICAEPSKASPAGGTGTVRLLSDVVGTTKAKNMMLVLLLTNINRDYSNIASSTFAYNLKAQGYDFGGYSSFNAFLSAVSSDIPSSYSDDDKMFLVGHILVGRLYTGVYDGIYNESKFEALLNSILGYYAKTGTYVIDGMGGYIAVTPGAQDIVWTQVEITPGAYFKLSKVDTNGDLISGPEVVFNINGTEYPSMSGSTDWIAVPLNKEFTYYEVSAPEGYEIDTKHYTAKYTTGGYYEASIVNRELSTGGVKIKKIDSETGSVTGQGQAKIQGAVFGVFESSSASDSEAIATMTINSKGTASAGPFEEGTYYVWEITPGAGYKKTTTKKSFKITSSSAAVIDLTNDPFTNTVIKGGLKLTKTKQVYGGSDAAFSGVSFRIKDSSGATVKTIKTGSDGVATTGANDLPYGTYTVVEVSNSANAAYNKVSNFSVTVNKDGTIVNAGTFRDTLKDSPTISSTARNSESSASSPNKELGLSSNESVTDVFNISGLTNDLTYRLKATLYDVSKNEAIGSTKTKEWTSSGNTSFEIVFSGIDTTGLGGKSLSVKATLEVSNNGSWVTIEEHNTDLTDAGQTVTVKNISLGTTATNSSGGKTLDVGKVSVVDTVEIEGLVPGESYDLVGQLVDEYGNVIALTNGDNSVIDSFTYQGEAGATHTVNMTFKVDTSSYIGKKIIVYETLYPAGSSDPIVTHKDLTDSGQTVNVKSVSISTVATGADGTSKAIDVGEVTVKDVVSYVGLSEGSTYQLKAELIAKNSGVVVGTANTSFTASGSSGDTSANPITFSFDSSNYYDYTSSNPCEFVVYEYLYSGDTLVTSHVDSADENQIVRVVGPTLSTVATNGGAGSENKRLNIGKTKVSDTVTYSGLITGKKYTFEGKLLVKNTEEVVASGTKTVNVEASSGTVDIEFSLDTSKYPVGTEFVVVETLRNATGKIVAEHYDLTDNNQTVGVVEAEVGTIATSNGGESDSKTLSVGNTSVKDVVSYSGLISGNTYTLKGQLINLKTKETVAEKVVQFTANGESGDTSATPMAFDVDTTKLVDLENGNPSLVVYESLYDSTGEVLIKEHKDDSDTNQVVGVKSVEIHTIATNNGAGGETKTLSVGNTSVKDVVSYSGLVSGNSYTLKGKLVNLNTKEVLAENSVKFTASGESGDTASTPMIFDVDTTKLVDLVNGNPNLVVYESLYNNTGDVLIAKHEDDNDTNQIVGIRSAGIGTVAKNGGDGSGEKTLNIGNTKVVDTIAYSGLVPGDTYTVKGSLRNKNDGLNVVASGEKSFVPENESGEVEVEFDIDTTRLYTLGGEQVSLVVYEALYKGDTEIAKHEEQDDTDQIVALVNPEVGTKAVDESSESGKVTVGETTVKDTVRYSGLVGGEWYKVVGTLMDKESRSELVINGNTVTESKSFQAETGGAGEVVVEFNIDTTTIQGKKIVVFEKLYRDEEKHGDGRELAKHEDWDDEGQNLEIKVAKIGTVAKDKNDGDNIIFPDKEQTIVDTVEYINLMKGTEYTMVGTVMVKETGEALEINGEKITVRKTFISSETGSGEVELEFGVDATDLPGVELVVFERLYRGEQEEVPTAVHEDINDDSQYIKVRERIGTEAVDYLDGDHKVGVGNVVIIDGVKYEGLTMGEKYVMEGRLMDKKTGEVVQLMQRCVEKPFGGNNSESGSSSDSENTGFESGSSADGEECFEVGDAVVTKIFTVGEADITGDGSVTTEKDGMVYLYFGINTVDLAGKDLVVFERLYKASEYGSESATVITEHEEIEDESQTISVLDPNIGTLATDKNDGEKELEVNADVTIRDEVKYKGLVPGETYTLKGVLMNKYDGKIAQFPAGGETEKEMKFVATGESGTVKLDFNINTTDAGGVYIVVFEELYFEKVTEKNEKYTVGEKLIAEHKDLDDAEQTVWTKVAPPETGGRASEDNGGARNGGGVALIIVGVAIVLGGGVAVLKKRRRTGKIEI